MYAGALDALLNHERLDRVARYHFIFGFCAGISALLLLVRLYILSLKRASWQNYGRLDNTALTVGQTLVMLLMEGGNSEERSIFPALSGNKPRHMLALLRV